jgi:hypothetical protein
MTNPTGNALIGIDPKWQQEQDRRAERDRRLQHYGAQARIAELEAALRACITENGHDCLAHWAGRSEARQRIAEINITAGAVLAKAT